MLEELTKTYDNPVNPVREQTFLSTLFSNGVNLSEWLSAEPSSHRVGGKGLRLIPQNKRRSKWGVNETILPNTHWNRLGITDSEQHLQDTLCAMPYALCDSDPNRGLPSVLAETDSSGNITAYYVYGLGLISKIEGPNAYFYQYDGIGSTVAITDKTGSLKNQYAYDDFGNLATNSTETIANPFKYVGKFGVMADANDLLYMRARYYIPSIGRFTQYDPLGAINPYSYVGNNPMSFIDPEGNIALLAVIGLAAYFFFVSGQDVANAPGPGDKTYESCGTKNIIKDAALMMLLGIGVGPRGWLFGRGRGLLNSNDFIRVGWSWKGTAKAGKEIFRIAIGSKRLPFHWHFP